MISRVEAESALSRMTYQRMNAGPSKGAIKKGILMPIYFSPDVSKYYAYGENGNVEGYICPEDKQKDREFIGRMIGFPGHFIIRKP